MLQLEKEAVIEGVFQRDAMQADGLRVFALAGLPHQAVKKVVAAPVRADHLHIAAPRNAGVGDRPKLARIGVQCKFVQNAPAPLASLGVRVAAHAVDAAAAGELQHVGGDLVLGVDHDFAQILGGQVHDPGPHLAVFDKQPRLQIVAAADPLIVPCALGGGAFGCRIGRGPAQADLAAFFHELEA